MRRSLRFGSLALALTAGALLASCAAPQGRAESAGKLDPKVGLATRALMALDAHDPATAVPLAEAAVEKTPDQAMLRTLLGNAYFAAGRLSSAEHAFKESLTLNSNQPQVILKLALVQAALGKKAEALAFLQAGQEVLNPSDYGLALALAGEPGQAVTVLDEAARRPGADSTVRQNLALSYALAGDWTQAKTIAAQDVPADQLDGRMREWMQLASPKKPSDQVAALVGVTPALSDAGEPVRLALRDTGTMMAKAAPAPAPGPVPAPEQVAAVEAPVVQVAAIPAVAVAPPPPPPATLVAKAAYVASAATSALAAAAERAEHAVSSFVSPKPAKVAAKRDTPRLAALRRAPRAGDAVMQIASYRSPEQVNAGWSRLTSRYPALRGYLPLRARFDSPKGTFWRLSVQGFSGRGEAVARCEVLRSRGGNCFVRPSAGDAPVQFASR